MTISILCGGSGTRLWPLSRELLPKQFAPILPNTQKNTTDSLNTLFAHTLKRNQILTKTHNATFSVITNDKHFFLAKDIAQEIGISIDSYILESLAKNTAPALCFAALQATEKQEDEIILALPSDHLIKDEDQYLACIHKALDLAQKGFLVTFGITPTTPHTGYGYIKAQNGIVEQFVEKPDLATAQKYLQSGKYFWNSGMFCFRADVFLRELQAHEPKLLESCTKAYIQSKHTAPNAHTIRLEPKVCEDIQEISIDYALMEKSTKVACVEGTFIWNDVGGFEALKQEWQSDEKGNATKGAYVQLDSANNFILSDKLVATIGIDNLAVVNSGDCLLIAPLNQTQRIKELIPILKTTYPESTQIHNTAHRPWGTYSVLLESHTYKIKQIIVKPKHRLSLQKHFHRNEHWIVVSGSALVQIGDKEVFLKANESTYIPMGASHRLENPGKIPLVLIEVQMGEYLGEDDIVRLEDDYKRS